MNKSSLDQNTLHQIIIGYRQTVEERYQYDRLKARYEIPDSFGADQIAEFRQYFLEYVYPDIEKREQLNASFENLDNYIKSPDRLLRLLIDSTSLLFKYGRHLPKILTTGLKALKSFRTANQFEERLVLASQELQLSPPFGPDKINQMIQSLPKTDLDAFVNSGQSLMETLYDQELVNKIQEIIQHLIGKMRKRPNVYSQGEIDGLRIGLALIKEGNDLFSQLSPKDQELVLNFIIKIEREHIEQLFD
ncbi:MAG: hypothetical protein AAFP19_07020 [Bacteroidota bacterium]